MDANDWKQADDASRREPFFTDALNRRDGGRSFYFFFSLFPALLLLAIASYFPVQTLVDEVFTALGGFAPPEAISIITDQIKEITEAKPGGLLTFGVAAAIWSSSSAIGAVISTQRIRHRGTPATGIGLIYYIAPDAEQDWVWITPGSIFATTLWLIASLGFKYSAGEVKTAAPQEPQRRGGGRPFDSLLGTFAIAQVWWTGKAIRSKTLG